MDLDAIKAATWSLHTRAERSGIVADILAGRASRTGVALLLRNLLPVYQALDHSPFGSPVLARSDAITADLQLLAPEAELPVLPQAIDYAERVRQAGDGLVAHAYVRYLGDLNGGRIMRRLLVRSIGAIAERMRFHDYPALDEPDGFTRNYRLTLDRAVRAAPFAVVEQEAVAAFELNIAVSEAVKIYDSLYPTSGIPCSLP